MSSLCGVCSFFQEDIVDFQKEEVCEVAVSPAMRPRLGSIGSPKEMSRASGSSRLELFRDQVQHVGRSWSGAALPIPPSPMGRLAEILPPMLPNDLVGLMGVRPTTSLEKGCRELLAAYKRNS